LSTPINKLLFFNKEGYPYNLNYDAVNEEWTGKMYFDPNSSDTFRTLCMYIFENVPSYNFTETFDLRASQQFNYSGMTFVPLSYTGVTIKDIQKVNSSPLFYSKWIMGDNFDRMFPVGSVVAFNGVTGSTYLSLNNFHGSGVTYYNVLGTQKNAFLITTITNNKDFDFVFSGGTVSSVNMLKVPDYGSQQLVNINNLNYYDGKKITVAGSENNDGVYTFDDYNILKTKVYDFILPTPVSYVTGGTITLEFYLMTQRPELYEGPIRITYSTPTTSGTTVEFFNYINTNIDFTTTGQTFVFEYPDGSHIDPSDPEFIIAGFVDKQNITTDVLHFYYNQEISTIEAISGITTGLTYNDYIEVIATPYVTGGTLHDKRQFQVLNITNNVIQVREYIIPESGYTYTINKIINKRKINKLNCVQNTVLPGTFTGYTVCYSTSNKITLTQDVVPSGTSTYFYENTISSMRNKYASLLARYGLSLYHYHSDSDGNNYLMFEGLDYNYQPYYSGVTAKINNNYLIKGSGFTYQTTGGTEDSDVFYFSTYEPYQAYERVYHYEKSQLAKNFYTEIYFDINLDSSRYGFNLNLNNIDYYIATSGNSEATYTPETINAFINKYSIILDKKGITVYSGYTYDGYTGYTLIIEGQQPNIELFDIEVKVNSYSDYEFIKTIHNHSIVIDSSELYLVNSGKSLYDYELATGMIIGVSGCSHTLNNKQYNILRITPSIIQLSYQGPFLYEYYKELIISINQFLRAPRGNYDRDVTYRLSWLPIEENDPQISPDIFYYDYSGSQLLPNGDLTYAGQKPLWNNYTNNLVFLNDEPNTNIEKIYDPEYQQTVFENLNYTLERLNSSVNYNYVPNPLQVFIGFNSRNEGVSNNILIMDKIENIVFSGVTNANSNILISSGSTESYIDYITNDLYFSFAKMGFEMDQNISLNFLENTITGHTIFGNYGTYIVNDVTDKRITVRGTLLSFDTSASGKTYDYTIKTEPDRIATINLYGQTEIEDERYVQHLKLLGANLDTEVQPIFKESDINEVGIDYTILNRKRKELLIVYPEIYNYIGSYKALINAINFFGYNDLGVYEYYKCIDPKSPLYGQLQRVQLQEIFNNQVAGWTDDVVMNFIPTASGKTTYLKTNLFNLTYRITDFDGNYVNMYSLEEVQIKLTKLVKWLRRHIIPLSANILDITGLAYVPTTLYTNYNGANWVKKTVLNQSNTVINFDYIQTLNIDTNYLFTINFYLTSGATMPDYWTVKIKTFHLDETTRELIPVQYIELFKIDLLSYSFNVDTNIDPWMYIETQSYNDYGLGYTNYKLFNYNLGRNFILINNNFTGINYKYLADYYGFYIIADGRYFIIKY
jgi:hypothetical protein